MDVLYIAVHLAGRRHADDWNRWHKVRLPAPPLSLALKLICSTLLSVVCADREYLVFEPVGSQTCEAYMSDYISRAGGYLLDPAATTNCQYCQLEDTDTFLASFNMS